MHVSALRSLLFSAALALVLPACASTPETVHHGGVVRGEYGPRTTYQGKSMSSMQGELESSTILTDGDGGVIILSGERYERPNPGYVDARELKLKVRELAEQLVADMRDCSLQGTVALPTAFVDLNNFERTSAFGRLVSEQLYYELNQRGYPVREYRTPKNIRVKDNGETWLSRGLGNVAASSGVVIAGTYQADRDAVFVNARLVRPRDGRVLRTANLVLDSNPLIKRLVRASSGGGQGVGDGTMRIRDFDTAVTPPAPTNLTPFDKGEDIH